MTGFATIVTPLFESKDVEALKNELKARGVAQCLSKSSEAEIKAMEAEYFARFSLDGCEYLVEKTPNGSLRVCSVEHPVQKEPTANEKRAQERRARERAKPPPKPPISIDVFRSLMLNALAETEVEREGRKKRIKDKRAKKTGKPEEKGKTEMAHIRRQTFLTGEED
jgi:hypothetical protein